MSDTPEPKQMQQEFTCRNCGQIFVLDKQNASVLTYTNPLHSQFTTLVAVCSHCLVHTNVFAPREVLQGLISAGCVFFMEREFAEDAVVDAYWKSLGIRPLDPNPNLSPFDERTVEFFRWQLDNKIGELQQWT